MNKKDIIVKTKNHIVRVREEDNGELKVFAHNQSKDGKEELPLAYILGFNSLIMNPKKR